MSKKKYPKDTPVTLEMLAEITNSGPTHERIKSFIEPPEPKPKEGEWWMCRYRNNEVDTIAVLIFIGSQWRLTPTVKTSWTQEFVTPLRKMVPLEEVENE